jgi:hypothetical protein
MGLGHKYRVYPVAPATDVQESESVVPAVDTVKVGAARLLSELIESNISESFAKAIPPTRKATRKTHRVIKSFAVFISSPPSKM